MGSLVEYLNQLHSPEEIITERKKQLRLMSELRGNRSILVMASDLQKNAPISIDYSDIEAVRDLLDSLPGPNLDVILETPGGSAEVAEDIIHLLRAKFDHIAFVIPGWAKSAGTIMTMAGDEILMDPASALGPIDAQIFRAGGKVFSADAFLKGLEEIKQEVERTGKLNLAYVPILQQISPGEIQHCENALAFAKQLVSNWLATYKFRNWTHHSSDGRVVTEEERLRRAQEIADLLCNHSHWKTHGRSIKIRDLEAMKLRIVDYSQNPPLYEVIRRYYTLLRMTFESNIYKVFETPTAQIYRLVGPQVAAPPSSTPDVAIVNFTCPKCGKEIRLQANLEVQQPLEPGHIPFPEDNRVVCPQCGAIHDLSSARDSVERESGKKIV